MEWPGDAQGALTLTFDDARPSQLDRGVPLFDELEVRATFFLLPHFRRRTEEWTGVIGRGHEVGSHTGRHPCSVNFPWSRRAALEDMTLADIEAEIDAGDAAIRDALGVDPTSFAYPCGQTFVGRGADVRSYVPVVARRFEVGRGYLAETANDPIRCDLAQVAAVASDSVPLPGLLDHVRQAARRRCWLVLAGHEVGHPGGAGTTTAALRCVVAEARQHGLWIETLAEVGLYVKRSQQARAAAGSVGPGAATNSR